MHGVLPQAPPPGRGIQKPWLLAHPLFVYRGHLWLTAGYAITHVADRGNRTPKMRKRDALRCIALCLGRVTLAGFIRQAKLQSLASLWHLLNGDTIIIIPVTDLASIFQFPSPDPPPK